MANVTLLDMELRSIDRVNTPEAKNRSRRLLLGVWVGSLVAFWVNGFLNWGGFVVAGLLTVLGWFAREEPHRMVLANGGLTIMRGSTFLWGAAVEDLAGIEIMQEKRRLGVVFSPKRVVFKKRGGDMYAIDFHSFHENELKASIRDSAT